MKVYRIERDERADHWPARGALYAPGRWNEQGFWVIYCSQTVALAKLELLANSVQLPVNRSLLEIEITSQAPIYTVTIESLPPDWMHLPYPASLHRLSEQLLRDNQYIALRVPSRQSPTESNILLYAPHPRFHEWVNVVKTYPIAFDERLK